jgi:hypothetical protein
LLAALRCFGGCGSFIGGKNALTADNFADDVVFIIGLPIHTRVTGQAVNEARAVDISLPPTLARLFIRQLPPPK